MQLDDNHTNYLHQDLRLTLYNKDISNVHKLNESLWKIVCFE